MNKLEKTNYEYCNSTISLKQDIEGQFLELGKRLWKIREHRMYQPQYETFDEYCLEFKMSRATVSKLVNIYDMFVKRFGIPESRLLKAGGWSCVAELLPIVTSKSSAIKWLKQAELLTRADLRISLTAKKKGIDPSDCEPHDKNYIVLKMCRRCGFKEITDRKGDDE